VPVASAPHEQERRRDEELLRTITFPRREGTADPGSDDAELVNPFRAREPAARTVSDLQ
jgi:hypothetical protein